MRRGFCRGTASGAPCADCICHRMSVRGCIMQHRGHALVMRGPTVGAAVRNCIWAVRCRVWSRCAVRDNLRSGGARREGTVRVRTGSRLRARALLSADACRPAAATEMADVHAVLVSRSGQTHLHDTSLRCVRAAQRATARPVTRYRLLGCHWASRRRTAASLARVPVPRCSALACRVQRQRLRMCRRPAT